MSAPDATSIAGGAGQPIPEYLLRSLPELRVLPDRAAFRAWQDICGKRTRRGYAGYVLGLTAMAALAGALGAYLGPLAARLLGWIGVSGVAAVMTGSVLASLLAVGASGFLLAWLFRHRTRRRVREGLIALGYPVCLHCGYDLRGSPEPRCSECGAAFDPSERERILARLNASPPKSLHGRAALVAVVLLVSVGATGVIGWRLWATKKRPAAARPSARPLALPADFVTGSAGDGVLTAALEQIRADNNLPALAAVSVTSAGIIEIAAVGVRAEGFPERVTVDDQWHLGSITKPMTATLAARLVEQGLIAWDTTVAEVFPAFEHQMRPEYRTVRLVDLLHHASGLPRDPAPERYQQFDQDISARAQRQALMLETLALPPVNPRGTVAYSNCGFIVAGAMLEERADTDFEELMSREVFTPLGMTRSGFGPPGTPGRRDQPWAHYPALRLPGAPEQAREIFGALASELLSAGQPVEGCWQPLDPSRPAADNPPTLDPCGRAHASLADMARFAAAHLAGSRGDTPFLTAASFRKLHDVPDDSGSALDWAVSTRDWAGGRWLYHSGSTGRWYAALTLAPDRDLAIFAATSAWGLSDEGNRGTDQAASLLIARLAAAARTRCTVKPDPPVTDQELNIGYRSYLGPLALSREIKIHYGVNGWQDVKDAAMGRAADGSWAVVLTVPENASQLDFVFTDGVDWDNNSGNDWHAKIHPAPQTE